MAIYAVGDVQGCYPELGRLLEKLRFEPATDRLIFCGDLVNRGGESLAVLRMLHDLGKAAIVTLGNHDLSLLAIGLRSEEEQARVNPDLRAILQAEDSDKLLGWLRQQPLLHHEAEHNCTVVHAGFAPRWTRKQARRSANEVERALRGRDYKRLLSRLFGDKPASWNPRLRGLDRMRASINVLTRMRFCNVHGRIAFDEKGPPGSQKAGLYPWFAVPGMTRRNGTIVCGHWSALGRFDGLGIRALDTGCVHGGTLSAYRIDAAPDQPRFLSVAAEPHRQRH